MSDGIRRVDEVSFTLVAFVRKRPAKAYIGAERLRHIADVHDKKEIRADCGRKRSAMMPY
ncbi:MAG: hypothetical protein U9Q68_02430 [Euryarchaeota archaeon]|nr:hypothetical protein [Euryarchaeota archaeon]